MTLPDIQAVADLTAKFLGLSIRPKAEIKKTRRGTALTHRGTFSIPEWALKRGEDYVTYYTIHEVCHFYAGGIHHGPLFKKVEDRALANWGLYIERKKVYPRRVFKGPIK
jgi:hypothetical protein